MKPLHVFLILEFSSTRLKHFEVYGKTFRRSGGGINERLQTHWIKAVLTPKCMQLINYVVGLSATCRNQIMNLPDFGLSVELKNNACNLPLFHYSFSQKLC